MSFRGSSDRDVQLRERVARAQGRREGLSEGYRQGIDDAREVVRHYNRPANSTLEEVLLALSELAQRSGQAR